MQFNEYEVLSVLNITLSAIRKLKAKKRKLSIIEEILKSISSSLELYETLSAERPFIAK